MGATQRQAITRALIRHERMLGRGKRPRKRLPRQQYPKLIESAYARELTAAASRIIRSAFAPLMARLPDILARAAAARRIDRSFALGLEPTPARLDAGEGTEARGLIDHARDRLTAGINAADIQDIASRFAVQTSAHNRVQLGRQVEAAVGVNVLGHDPTNHHIVSAFVDSNVALIRGLTDKVAADVSSSVFRGIQDGKPFREIAGDLSNRFGMAERRATLIGRDQIGKLYGQINVMRQKQLGVTRFIWTTVGDDHVRDEHVDRDGQEYSYDDPPDGELPGEPVLCRCWADPVMDDLDTGDDDSGDEGDSGDDAGDDVPTAAFETVPEDVGGAIESTPADEPDDVQPEAPPEDTGGAIPDDDTQRVAALRAELAQLEADRVASEGAAGAVESLIEEAHTGFRIGVSSEITGALAGDVPAAEAVIPLPTPGVAAAVARTEPAAVATARPPRMNALMPSAVHAPTGYTSFSYNGEIYYQHAAGTGPLFTPVQFAEYQAGRVVELAGPNETFPGFDALAKKGDEIRYRTHEFFDGNTMAFTRDQITSGEAAKDMQWLRDHAAAEQAKHGVGGVRQRLGRVLRALVGSKDE